MRFRDLDIVEEPPLLLGADRRHWLTAGRMAVEWTDEVGERLRLELKAGTRFRPSIPRVFRGVVVMEDILLASALHDRIYRETERREGKHRVLLQPAADRQVRMPSYWSRETVDRLMVAVMDADGASEWSRLVTHLAVRAAGRSFWFDD